MDVDKVTSAADGFPELVEADVLAAFEIFDQNGNGFMPLQVTRQRNTFALGLCAFVRIPSWHARVFTLNSRTGQELVDVLKNLGEGVPDNLLEQLKKVAEPDEEQQVNIRHLVDILLKTGV